MSVHTDVRNGLSGERVLELPRQLHRERRCVRARRGGAQGPPGRDLLLRARERLRLSRLMIAYPKTPTSRSWSGFSDMRSNALYIL
jgi:hypothetical protein